MNKIGEIVFRAHYDEAGYSVNGVARVYKDGMRRYIANP
ncbi:WG repeat-containing protein [Bacillus sp. ISL-41]|nr:WG repeat-containing protein [Bacillus sp. ISL-41]